MTLLALWLFAAAHSAPTLAVDDVLPPLGGTLTATITGGTPGAPWVIGVSERPAETSTAAGILTLDAPVRLTGGTLDATGSATALLALPAGPSWDGAVRYLQVAEGPLATAVLGNGVSVRLGPRPAFRRTEAVAATATRVYAAHRDGTLSVVDPVTDTLVADLALGPVPVTGTLPVRAEVDPEGRHLFVVDPQQRSVAVVHTGLDTVVAQLPVTGASRDVAFDFGVDRLVYVTSEVERSVQVFREAPLGVFTAEPSLPLAGDGPGPLAVLADGRIAVGHRATHELELVDPLGGPAVRIPLGVLPHDVVVKGSTLLLPVFDPSAPGQGSNRVLEVDPVSATVVGSHLADHGTDYVSVAWDGSRVAAVGAGSGSVVVADAAFGLLDVVDTAPLQPVATPTDAVFAAGKLYTVNTFRESLAVTSLAGPPFAVVAEVALAWSGAPLVPLVDLGTLADGDWFFRSVQLFGGGPADPNVVTCATCHPYGGSDAIVRPSGRQVLPMYDSGLTAPYGSFGTQPSLLAFVSGAMSNHDEVAAPSPAGAAELVTAYLHSGNPAPVSPHLLPDGSRTAEAEAGRLLFEGVAGCAACHTAPAFVPVSPAPKTIAAGVGTGLVPANVPTLLGVWSTPPYLHDGSAATLLDVVLLNGGDQHGTTSVLSALQRSQLAAYVASL